MSKSCQNCCYGDKCTQEEICEHYYPIEPQAEDELIYEVIENGRIEYRRAWLEYIDEDSE